MANRSTFPTTIDSFLEHSEMQATDKPLVLRFQELTLKSALTPTESDELASLTSRLRNKLQTAEDFNKLQDAITNLQVFFRDEVDGYVTRKQVEMNEFSTQKKTEVNTYVDDFTRYVNTQRDSVYGAMTESIDTMQGRRDSFGNYVDTKEDELRGMVQDFDSRTTRYYQTWTAKDGQVIYNIFNGEMGELPSEARLMLDADDIDVVIQGTLLKPYVDYDIAQNGNYDSIELKGNASELISAGTEIIAKWYKNVGKLYFKHSSTHALGGTDEIRNIQSQQLHSDLQDKIDRGNISISTLQPKEGLWLKVIG